MNGREGAARGGEPAPAFQRPIWDRGDEIDPDMLAFTIGDDWFHDRRLVEVDIRGSLAHARGLLRSGLIAATDLHAIETGLQALLESHRRGEWNVERADEDVHSAVERRLIEAIGDSGKKLHTARSRNEQVALDVRLWLRGAIVETWARVERVIEACRALDAREGNCALPGYTHLRRAMPSSFGAWIQAHAAALELDRHAFDLARAYVRSCPLGSGAGYGVPVALDREGTARELGFESVEEPVTLTQHSRGRAELAYLTALEQVALDLDKLMNDVWLYSTREFGFVRLPTSLTTGSSMMPQKRNPDLIELSRAHCRQVSADREALLETIRGLPSGYHRDFQLVKPPLFRGHDRLQPLLELAAKLLGALEIDRERANTACEDPALLATQRALEKVRAGIPFRDAYREESRRSSG